MATTESRRPRSLLAIPPIRDYGSPGWFERLPAPLGVGGVLVLLLLISGYIRVHYLNGELWSDEANTVGIASHSLTAIPGVLWQGGGAPLYFWILHVWMEAFGSTEIAVHALSVLFGLLTVPAGLWLGWSLHGRRVGLMLAVLLAFSAYLTKYAEEARPYELFALLGLLTTGAFLHAFVHDHRRGWLPAFAAGLVLLAYTDAWGFFFWAGAALALIPLARRSERRAGLLRDAGLAFGAAFVLYLPWLPTLVHQAASATAPWHYIPLAGANFPRDALGTDRVDVMFGIVLLLACATLFTGPDRRGREANGVLSMAIVGAGAFALAGLATLLVPALAGRYMGAIVAPLLVLVALASARTGLAGLILLLVSCVFLAHAASFIPNYKSDMRDVAAEVAPSLHPGDLVVVTQPEQAPLADYYFPSKLRYATPLGPDPHPGYMNWDDAMTRLQRTSPRAAVARLVASLAPGAHLVLIRPLTEGVQNWAPSWASLVRLRSAQWSAQIAADPQLRLVSHVFAPHNYRGSCCVSSSALLYVKR